jgi:hypothetical protein
MNVKIDKAGSDNEAAGIDDFRVLASRLSDSPINDEKIGDAIALVRRIDDPPIPNHQVHGVAIPPQR